MGRGAIAKRRSRLRKQKNKDHSGYHPLHIKHPSVNYYSTQEHQQDYENKDSSQIQENYSPTFTPITPQTKSSSYMRPLNTLAAPNCGWYRPERQICTIKVKSQYFKEDNYCLHPETQKHTNCPVWQFRFSEEEFRKQAPKIMRALEMDVTDGVPGSVKELEELLILALKTKGTDKITNLNLLGELEIHQFMLSHLKSIPNGKEFKAKYGFDFSKLNQFEVHYPEEEPLDEEIK